MDDPGAVREVERLGDLDGAVERLVQLERSSREPRLEGLARRGAPSPDSRTPRTEPKS